MRFKSVHSFRYLIGYNSFFYLKNKTIKRLFIMKNQKFTLTLSCFKSPAFGCVELTSTPPRPTNGVAVAVVKVAVGFHIPPVATDVVVVPKFKLAEVVPAGLPNDKLPPSPLKPSTGAAEVAVFVATVPPSPPKLNPGAALVAAVAVGAVPPIPPKLKDGAALLTAVAPKAGVAVPKVGATETVAPKAGAGVDALAPNGAMVAVGFTVAPNAGVCVIVAAPNPVAPKVVVLVAPLEPNVGAAAAPKAGVLATVCPAGAPKLKPAGCCCDGFPKENPDILTVFFSFKI